MRLSTLHNPVIGIVADDLTSAADAAGPFSAKGLSALVRCADGGTSVSDNHQIVSIDCGSRTLSEENAIQSVAKATGSIAGASLLYKTIDSTLRGHIKSEIAAAFRASGRKRIVIAPAFPEAGRITRKGIQFVDGVPVSEADYSRDPVHPAKTSKVSDLVPAELTSVTVLDAETQESLNGQVAAIHDPEEVLWVGSPGIAIALAELSAGFDESPKPLPSCKKCLVVVGSANDVSRMQVMQLKDSDRVSVLSAPVTRSATPKKILQLLVRGATELVRTGQFDALIATGGETMAALLKELHVTEFSLVGDFEPGFPLGEATLPNGQHVLVGLKAGGFGSKNTLVNAVDALQPSLEQRSKVS